MPQLPSQDDLELDIPGGLELDFPGLFKAADSWLI
jgi:hypothetical protein